jgi:flagellar biosynthesis chaperone FliJ
MNKTRRKAIVAIREQLERINDTVNTLMEQISEIKEEEQDYFDNMPESLQSSPKGEATESVISCLESAIDHLDDHIAEAIGQLEEAEAT